MGLAEVVVVVEHHQSRAMITGQLPWNAGGALGCSRGSTKSGQGSNLLIFDGAYPLIDVDSFVHLMKGSRRVW